ncbi:MAG: hypothetical protein UHX00_04605 [Caryophanon sp.]|nr:hypothetical protein [Caryophanon sp.]
MTKPGRRLTISKEEVNTIISLFKNEVKPSGLIKPMEIHKYSEALFQQKRISALPAYEFWKKKDRLGRQLIDLRNQIDTVTLKKSDGNDITIPNITDLVQKKHNNIDDLIESLLPLENHLRSSFKREHDLKIKCEKLESELSQAKLSNKESHQELEKMQNLIFNLYRIIMREYKSESKEFAISQLNNSFSSTQLNDLEEKIINTEAMGSDNQNIVSIESKKKFKNTFKVK